MAEKTKFQWGLDLDGYDMGGVMRTVGAPTSGKVRISLEGAEVERKVKEDDENIQWISAQFNGAPVFEVEGSSYDLDPAIRKYDIPEATPYTTTIKLGAGRVVVNTNGEPTAVFYKGPPGIHVAWLE
jgi:hypothetical protein